MTTHSCADNSRREGDEGCGERLSESPHRDMAEAPERHCARHHGRHQGCEVDREHRAEDPRHRGEEDTNRELRGIGQGIDASTPCVHERREERVLAVTDGMGCEAEEPNFLLGVSSFVREQEAPRVP